MSDYLTKPLRAIAEALSDMAEARERDPHIAFRRDQQRNHWCRKTKGETP